MKTLVIDIETVRDRNVVPDPENMPEGWFAPPQGWMPVCIGIVLFDGYHVEDIHGAVVDSPVDVTQEKWLLYWIRSIIIKHKPTLVTWNGRGFDLPVLMLRSMRHGVQQPWYYLRSDMRYRYSEEGHLDLADAMGDYGAARTLKLDSMARLIGLPGKFGDFDGLGVEAAYAERRYDEIADYCRADVVQAAFLWLRWRLLRGELNLETYRVAAKELLAACEGTGRMGKFLGLVDRGVLLLGEKGNEEKE